MKHSGLLLALFVVGFASICAAQTRDEQVRNDKSKLAENDNWIYNDFDQAVEEAKATAKALLVVFR